MQPDKKYESPELIYGFNMGRGTTVYQGDNRFSLRDIEFYQHKVELRRKGDWFIRAYRTSEDAGNSYDPYATALRMQDSLRSDYNWSKVYTATGSTASRPRSTRLTRSLKSSGTTLADCAPSIFTLVLLADCQGAEEQWYAAAANNLQLWHDQVEAWTNRDGGIG